MNNRRCRRCLVSDGSDPDRFLALSASCPQRRSSYSRVSCVPRRMIRLGRGDLLGDQRAYESEDERWRPHSVREIGFVVGVRGFGDVGGRLMEAGGFVLYISNRMQKRQQRVPGRLVGSPFMDYPEFTPVNQSESADSSQVH